VVPEESAEKTNGLRRLGHDIVTGQREKGYLEKAKRGCAGPLFEKGQTVENAEAPRNEKWLLIDRLAKTDRTATEDAKDVLMHSVWFGEFIGTLVLVLFGCGVNAGVTLKKSYAENAGWLVIATGWGLAVLCGVLVAQAFGSPGANLNPAITLANGVISGDYSQVLSLWSAQMVGAMAGAALMAIHYAPHWALTPDPAAKLGVFCTKAAVRSPIANLISEALGTGVLVLVAGAIGSRGVAANGLQSGLAPVLVASLVWGIGLGLGGTTGYAINPARDLGPRLVHTLLPIPGKGNSNWSYAPIPIVGDLLGALLAGILLRSAHL
jgi:glycerol uptake facilitator protein